MFSEGWKTRRAGMFGDVRHGGPEVEVGAASVPISDHDYIPEWRKRDQQACRDYWVSMYGAAAERTSRGGVTWLA